MTFRALFQRATACRSRHAVDDVKRSNRPPHCSRASGVTGVTCEFHVVPRMHYSVGFHGQLPQLGGGRRSSHGVLRTTVVCVVTPAAARTRARSSSNSSGPATRACKT